MKRTRKKRIGVIGTRATIASQAYVKAIRRLDPSVEVISQACPLFVPVVEEGLEGDEVAGLVVEKYLRGMKDSAIDVLVMGCTHYPILEPRIRELLGDDVYIVNSGREPRPRSKRCFRCMASIRIQARAGLIILLPMRLTSCPTWGAASSASLSKG